MIHHPASSQPRRTERRTPRFRRWATGLTVTAAAVLAGAPAALAGPRPAPDGGGLPVSPPPPPPTPAAHLPLWAVAAIVAATVVLSVATTLITLSLERTCQARRTPAAAAEPQAGHGDIIASHHYQAGHESYQAGNRLRTDPTRQPLEVTPQRPPEVTFRYPARSAHRPIPGRCRPGSRQPITP